MGSVLEAVGSELLSAAVAAALTGLVACRVLPDGHVSRPRLLQLSR
ncbi:hypothetical protein ACTWQF_31800 [Streptomyces sp. 8N114]